MIVVAGEALVDLIPNAAGEFGVHPGGGPFNSARWLAWLGADVAFLGALSADTFGQRLHDGLITTGVSDELVLQTAAPTTLAVAQLDANGTAAYSFYLDATSVCDLTAGQAQDRIRAQRPVALLAGGIALVAEPVGTALEAAIAAAHECGALVMIDPNVRPDLITDRDGYLGRMDRLLAHTDIMKCSVEDLAWLAGELEPSAAAAQLLDRFPIGAVLVTDAGAGVLAAARGGTVRVPATPVDVVDTIGAGDAFNAGFLAAWLGGGQRAAALTDLTALEQAVAAGTVVAARACQQRGATPPARPAPRLDTAAPSR